METVKPEGESSSHVDLDSYLQRPVGVLLKEVLNGRGCTTAIQVPYNETIVSVLQVLRQSRLRCVVVSRRHVGCFPSSFLCGRRPSYSFFDVRDLCYHVIRVYQESPCSSVDDILLRVQNQKVGRIANASKRVPFISHQSSQPLSEIIAGFGPSCRVPIFDGPRLVRILAPADLLTLLRRHDLVDQIAQRKVSGYTLRGDA